MGLGTGLTGVASSVSPTAPDGFGLFLGSHGAAFAFHSAQLNTLRTLVVLFLLNAQSTNRYNN